MARKSSKKVATKMTMEDIAVEAIALKQQDYTTAEIAEMLNVTKQQIYSAVFNHRRKNNVPVRKYAKKSSVPSDLNFDINNLALNKYSKSYSDTYSSTSYTMSKGETKPSIWSSIKSFFTSIFVR